MSYYKSIKAMMKPEIILKREETDEEKSNLKLLLTYHYPALNRARLSKIYFLDFLKI